MEEVVPPTDLLTLENLPFDAQKQLALDLPYESVISLCTSSKKLGRICEDLYFWKNYLTLKVPNVSIPEGADLRWYKNKSKEYFKAKNLVELIHGKKVEAIYIKPVNVEWNVFEIVENLRELFVFRIELTALPYMENLQELACDYNQLTSIPSMPNLIVLYCEHNQLTSLPSMPSLKRLYCGHNELVSLPSFPNLQTLQSDYNQLTFLSPMPNLKQLYCRYNHLTSLPSMPNLTVLYCEYNPLPNFTLKYWRKIWSAQNREEKQALKKEKYMNAISNLSH